MAVMKIKNANGNWDVLEPVGAIKYTAQTLTESEKAQARANIGAGANGFSGNYDDLINKPTIPSIEIVEDLPGIGVEDTIYLQSQMGELDISDNVQSSDTLMMYSDSWNSFGTNHPKYGKTYAFEVIAGQKYQISSAVTSGIWIGEAPWSGVVWETITVASNNTFTSNHNGYATFSAQTVPTVTSMTIEFYTSSVCNGTNKFYPIDPALAAYPIGSVYMSIEATSPSALFGGTWEQLKDRFLIGAGGSYSGTGGATTHRHGLSSGYAQIYMGGLPGVSSSTTGIAHAVTYNASYNITSGRKYQVAVDYGYTDPNAVTSATKLGGNSNNTETLPPYLAVYMWKRIA